MALAARLHKFYPAETFHDFTDKPTKRAGLIHSSGVAAKSVQMIATSKDEGYPFGL